MEHQVTIGEREATLVVTKRVSTTVAGIGGVLGRAFGEVYGSLAAGGAAPDGPPFVIYHGSPATGEPFDVEICAPVARRVEPPPGWRTEELPAGTFLTLLHVGPYEALGAAYATLQAWVATHDLTVTGPPREVYLSEPGTPPAATRTIIEFPVATAPRPVAHG
ncbi:MAG: GyrI-like domain-containing protein [Chloroflexi bacterium]|nr:GyrI-like domain-containing protein [Chloroflexota bacterium]